MNNIKVVTEWNVDGDDLITLKEYVLRLLQEEKYWTKRGNLSKYRRSYGWIQEKVLQEKSVFIKSLTMVSNIPCFVPVSSRLDSFGF